MANGIDFELVLPGFRLEGGAALTQHVVRGWAWGPPADTAVYAARGRIVDPQPWRVVRRAADDGAALPRASGPGLDGRGLPPAGSAAEWQRGGVDARVPTIVVVHALTGDARAGDWWGPVIGPGQPLDPTYARILCFNLLGGCYGTSGPADAAFPRKPDGEPAVVTTWDQARSILAALDALGVTTVDLVTGGSLGGMVALALATLAPARFLRLAPIAAAPAASPWILAWNHVARTAILGDPGFPEDASRGLHLARQIAMTTYRAEPGFWVTQGRGQRATGAAGAGWSPDEPYNMATYLAHQGDKLVARFDARAYLALLGAMDHHDLDRAPTGGVNTALLFGSAAVRGQAPDVEPAAWRGAQRITAAVLAVGIDSDQLYAPEHGRKLAAALPGGRYRELTSLHGHDAFLIEWDQLRPILAEAVTLWLDGIAAVAL